MKTLTRLHIFVTPPLVYEVLTTFGKDGVIQYSVSANKAGTRANSHMTSDTKDDNGDQAWR